MINSESTYFFTSYAFPQDSAANAVKKKKKKKKKKAQSDSLQTKNNGHQQTQTNVIADTAKAPDHKTDSLIHKPQLLHFYLGDSSTRWIDPNPKFQKNWPEKAGLALDSITKQNIAKSVAQPSNLPAKEYKQYREDWMVLVIIAAIATFGWVRSFYNKYLAQLFSSVYNFQIAYKLFNEKNNVSQRVSFILNTVFILNISLFVYLILSYFKIKLPPYNGLIIYFAICAIFILLYFLRYTLFKLVGASSGNSKVASVFIFNTFVYNKIFGGAIIPVLLILPYIDFQYKIGLIFTGVSLFAIIFSFRLIRAVQICIKINFSILYLILYICAVEILPMLLIGKVISNLLAGKMW